MGHKLITMDRPSDEQSERRVFWAVEHNCSAAYVKKQVEGQEAALGCDALVFPVGVYGSGMPTGVPFEVQSTEPCGACGTILKIWFQWTPKMVIDLGAK